MKNVGNWVTRLLGFEPASGHSSVHSPEELEMLVHSSTEAGLIEKSEERMIQRVFDFSDVQAREIMRPRTEVDAVALDTPLPDLLKLIAALHYSRYPVYQGTVDTVCGLLHTKDLLDRIGQQPQLLTDSNGEFKLSSILRAPLFVPETIAVDRLLERMQHSKQQMAIVLDEYGGMAGVATMEDILEELVGEVNDEFDEPSPAEQHVDASLVDGLSTLSDVADRFGQPEGKVISTTVGGYVAERLDRIPVVGDVVQFGDYDVRVEAMDGLRAAKLRFIPHPNQPKQEPAQQQE
jgi:CBS domain containing-hemolysin-like protein